MNYISFRYDICHTHCSICLADCFQKTFFLKECEHSFCMKCVSFYFDKIKNEYKSSKLSQSYCPSCISILPITPVLKEEVVHTLPREQLPSHTKEASPLP